MKTSQEINNLNDKNTNCKRLHSINQYLIMKNLHHKNVNCIIELSDKRIVTGSYLSISICFIDLLTKEWNQISKIDKAHNDWINYISELNNKRIASCSEDLTIKIWDVSDFFKTTLITAIVAHTHWIFQIITLTNNRIASIARDKTIKIWDDLSFKKIETPFETQENEPFCAIQLKKQNEILCVSLSKNYEGRITFYSLTYPYEQKGTIEQVFTSCINGMIELANGHIALSMIYPSISRIVIVDPLKYMVVKEIIDCEHISQDGAGSMCFFNEDSFIYGFYGCFCQIAYVNEDYKIVFSTKEPKQDLLGGLLLIENGNYFISRTSKGKQGNIIIYECEF